MAESLTKAELVSELQALQTRLNVAEKKNKELEKLAMVGAEAQARAMDYNVQPGQVLFYARAARWRSVTASGKDVIFEPMFPSLPAAARKANGMLVNVNHLSSDAGTYRGYLATDDAEVVAFLRTRTDPAHRGYTPDVVEVYSA